MYIIAVLMYMLTYNAKPEDGEERWITVFNVNEHISFFINNDSFDFINLTHDNSKVIASHWQSRPLIFYILGTVYSTVDELMHILSLDRLQDHYQKNIFWISIGICIIMNFIIIAVSIIWIGKYLGDRVPRVLFGLAFSLLAFYVSSNNIVGAYWISGSWNMFHFAIPAVATFLLLKYNKVTAIKHCFIYGIFSGILPLLYPAFYLLFIIFPLFIIVKCAIDEKCWNCLNKCSPKIFLYAIGFLIPLLLWKAIILYNDIPNNVTEITKYKLFIWPIIVYNEHGFGSMMEVVWSRFIIYNKLLGKLGIVEIIFFLLAISIHLFFIKKGTIKISSITNSIQLKLLIILLSSYFFWFFMGLYRWNYCICTIFVLFLYSLFSFPQFVEKKPYFKSVLYLFYLFIFLSQVINQYILDHKYWS